MRLVVVLLGCVVFAWTAFGPGSRGALPSNIVPRWSCVAFLAFAVVHAAVVFALGPRRILSPIASRLVRLGDSLLIFAWIAVNGGVDSPWTIALYVMVASRSLRYSVRATVISAIGFGIGLVALAAALGQVEGHVGDLVVRVAFMILLAWGAAVSAHERGRLLASRLRLLDLTQEVAQVGTWEWLIRDDVICWTDELHRIFGVPRDVSPTFTRYLDAIHPEDRADVESVIARALAERGEIRFDHRIVRPDGSIRWLHCRGRVLLGEDGEPYEMVGSAQDVTERRKMQEQLRFTDKLASIGTMASGIAHEINNPLAYLANNVAIIERRLEAPEGSRDVELREAVAAVRQASERVRDIVRGLKTFSRTEDDVRSHVDLGGVADLAITIVSHEIGRHARLIRDYRNVPRVYGSESGLSQVLVNLLINAAQAIDEGGKADNEIRVCVHEGDAGTVRLSVSDTGSGIAAGVVDRIFDPFFTTKPTGVGTGLGLSICHGIVRDHGGDITVQSTLGKGTTFFVTLPAVASSVTDRASSPTPEPSPSPVRARILVVDDEPRYGRSLSMLLGANHDVKLAQNGKEALAALGRESPFDVVLCDLMMPEMTGMDLYERLDAEQRGRVVFLTGGATTDSARAFLARPEIRYLEKPVDPSELERLIERRSSARVEAGTAFD